MVVVRTTGWITRKPKQNISYTRWRFDFCSSWHSGRYDFWPTCYSEGLIIGPLYQFLLAFPWEGLIFALPDIAEGMIFGPPVIVKDWLLAHYISFFLAFPWEGLIFALPDIAEGMIFGPPVIVKDWLLAHYISFFWLSPEKVWFLLYLT